MVGELHEFGVSGYQGASPIGRLAESLGVAHDRRQTLVLIFIYRHADGLVGYDIAVTRRR